VVFTSLGPEYRALLEANFVLDAYVVVEQTVDDGLDFCERQILSELMSTPTPNNEEGENDSSMSSGVSSIPSTFILSTLIPSKSVLHSRRSRATSSEPKLSNELWNSADNTLEKKSQRWVIAERKARQELRLLIESFFGWGIDGIPSITSAQAEKLTEYWSILTVKKGDVVFDAGFLADAVYLVLSGEIVLYHPSEAWRHLSYAERAAIVLSSQENGNISPERNIVFGTDRQLIQRARYGSMIGELYWCLQSYRELAALAEKRSCLFVLTAAEMDRMAHDDPNLSIAIQKIVSRSLALTLVTLQDLQDVIHENHQT